MTAEEDSDNLKISDENLKELSKWGESLNETLRYYGITDNYRGLTNKEAKYVLRLLANTRRIGRNEKKTQRNNTQNSYQIRGRIKGDFSSIKLLFQTDTNSFYGIHNISEDKLNYALKNGGLANPSIAIVDKDKSDFTGYGSISLITKSSLIDKKTGNNTGIYGADIYSDILKNIDPNTDYNITAKRIIEGYSQKRLSFNDYLEQTYGLFISDENMKKLNSLIQEFKDMPTEYFEVKFTRPIFSNEFNNSFSAAVMPEKTDNSLKKQLKDLGLKVYEYTDKDSRKKAIQTALKNSETTEQILFQIEDNLSDLTSSELETVNFQTEQEMAEEAKSFKSWEDFKEYIEATASWLEDDEPPLPSGADDAWYKTFWEKAQQADKAEQFTEENTRKQSGNIIEEDESEKDRQWYEMMSEEGKLEEFLIAIGQTQKVHSSELR